MASTFASYFGLRSTLVYTTAGTPAPAGAIYVVSSNVGPVWTNTLTVSSFSTLLGSSITISTLTVSTINGLLPGTGSGSVSTLSSTMVSIGASTSQSNTFSGGSFTTGWGSTLTGLAAITDVAMNQSGQYQLAIQNGSSTIRTSANSGVTWGTLTGANGLPAGATAYPQATAAGTPNYTSISASANGQYQLASVRGGLLYVCANGTSATPTFTAVGLGTPSIYLPMEGSITDVMSGTTLTTTGSPGYVTGVVGSQALNLANPVGGTAVNYVRGSWSLPSNFTISFWVNQQSSSSSAPQMIFCSAGGTVAILFNTSNQMYANFLTGGGTNYTAITTSFAFSLNTWYHIYYLFQTGGMCALYVNGVLIGSFTNTGGIGTSTTSAFGLGTWEVTDTSIAFNGYIDDFRIYNSAITYSPIVPMNWVQTAVSATGQYMLAAAANGGVFQSSNFGVTWSQLTTAQIASLVSPGQAVKTINGPIVTPNSSLATSASWTVNGMTWTVSASTFYQAGFEAYRIFDTTPNSSTWASGSNYNTSGAYTGALFTSVLGNVGNVSGDWIQIQSSTPLTMYSYSFTAAAPLQWPKTYYIVGSNDGTSWFPVQSVSLPSSPAGGTTYATPTNVVLVNQSGSQTVSTSGGSAVATCTTYPFSTNSYTYFRMIAPTICGIGYNFCLSEWYINFTLPMPLYVAPSSTITSTTPNMTGLAAASWTTNGVTWTASSSPNTGSGYFAFNNNYASGNNWLGQLGPGRYNASGAYTGTTSTIILDSIGTIGGEWVQLQSSVPLILTNYAYATGNYTTQVKTMYIVGSTDGTNWYPLQLHVAAANPFNTDFVASSTYIVMNYTGTQTVRGQTSQTVTTTAYSRTTQAFSYFRFIVNNNFLTTVDAAQFGELYPVFTTGTSVPAPSNTSQLTVTPQQLGLAGYNWTTGSGVTWVASASTTYGVGYEAWKAFANAYTSRWIALSSTYSTAGNSSGIYTPIQDVGTVQGDWLQLQSSVPLVMSSYQFATGFGIPTRIPKTFYLIGSTDGVTWYPIQYGSVAASPSSSTYTLINNVIIVNSATNFSQTFGSSTLTTTGYSTTTNAYTYFRLLSLSINTSSADILDIGEWVVNFTAATPNPINTLAISNANMMTSATSTTAPNVVGLPSSGNAITTSPWTTNGVTWTARASSVFDPAGTTPVSSAFNSVSSTEWVPLSATYTTNGNSSGQTTTIQTVGTVTGEWLQIQSSLPLVMASYQFATGNVVARTPKTYYIAGSNDGTTWFPIQYGAAGAVTTTASFTLVPGIILVNSSSTQTFGSSTITTTTYSTTTNAYTYFRLICLSNYSGPNDVVSLGEWLINFQNGLVYTSANNGSTWSTTLTAPANAPLLATAGSYVLTAANQTAYLYSNGISGAYTTPTLTGINANISWAAMSFTGQFMVLVTQGTTNNVYYSINFGVTWTALTVGSAPMTSCAMSADGSYITVSNATTVFTLNRGTYGFTVAVGNTAGAVNQGLNAIAIGNQAGPINQSANSIILNASGSAVNSYLPGFYATPIATTASSNVSSFNLLGYGSDSQIVQTGIMTLANGNVGIGTTAANGSLQFSNALANRKIVLWENANNDHQYYGVGVNFGMLRYQVNTTSDNHVFYAGASTTASNELMRIMGNGYVGIGTTAPTNPLTIAGSMTIQGQLFSVGGVATTYYPVLIDASPSWATTNTYRFNISRSSVHMDGSWKGAVTIVVEGHATAWGNGANYMKYKIMGNTDGPVSYGNFLGNLFEDFTSTFIVVYLRGGSTYYFSGQGCLLNNANASGTSLIVPGGNNSSYASTTSATAPFGSNVVSGDSRDNIWTVNSNVGIGTSAPTSLLHVNGAINCTSFLVNGTAVATGTGSVWGVSGSTAYYTSGFVGVGTAAPLARFTIRNRYDEGDTAGLCIDSSDGSTYNMRLSSFTPAGAQVSYRFGVNNISQSSPNTLVLAYNGNVGISSTVPLQRLYVDDGSIGINSRNQISGGAAVYFYNTPYGWSTAAKTAIITEGINNYTMSKLHLCTNGIDDLTTSASVANARLTVMPWGAVGINSSSPGFRFVVDNTTTSGINTVILASGMGSGTTTSLLLGKALSANNCGTFLWNHIADGSAANYVGLGYYNGDNKLNVTCSGYVGIGTTAPTQPLDLATGPIQLRNGNTNLNFSKYQLIFGYDGSTSYSHAIATRHNSGNPNHQNAIDFLTWTNTQTATAIGNNVAMSVTSGGVGIGTTAPQGPFHVHNSSGWSLLRVSTSSTSYASALLIDPAGTVSPSTPSWFIGERDTGHGPLSIWPYNGTTHLSNAVTISATGNVGIGTNAPGQTLDVYGTIARSGLKLPRTDYGTLSAATSVSIPILFNDTQYNVVELRLQYIVSVVCNVSIGATSATSETLTINEAGLTIVKWSTQSVPVYSNTSGTPTSFIIGNTVEVGAQVATISVRLSRATGAGTLGSRNHFSLDHVYCWQNVGTSRAYGQGHIDNTSVGGSAIASLVFSCSTGNISGTYSTTHYN